ncbi:DUF368 domain-containing protein [Halomonas sp. CUBES01]|uniref:DUF368 domain-containing protein n=1 Tax=Halomonas sp. CUBES01 TaxID=2897340 RepID=UPI001E518DFD|nr:DUF368 domain-containing protein [Halomonas sp. CUBES01]MEC4768256.1 DUF368 domain-containing protein [Halomonas sp. CUBES01]
MKRQPVRLLLTGAGMGAADAVPGVSGGTIAFISGIYEELILTIKQFGPGAFGAWRQGGWSGLVEHLNLAFLVPLFAGIVVSLFSVAHLALWLMDAHPLLLDGFFFGLVAASAIVVSDSGTRFKLRYLFPLGVGLLLAQWLPGLMPLVSTLGNESLILVVAGSIAISAMLLPGVSGSFLLLTMGLYSTVMEAIRGLDVTTMALFGGGCLIGLALFSRLLSWLLTHHRGSTLQLLLGFIIGSLPVLWPWRELLRYQLGGEGEMIPLDYRYLLPGDYAQLTGESAQLIGVIALMAFGALLVVMLHRRGLARTTPTSPQTASAVEKE